MSRRFNERMVGIGRNLSGVNLAAGSSGKWGESSGRKKLVIFLVFFCMPNQPGQFYQGHEKGLE